MLLRAPVLDFKHTTFCCMALEPLWLQTLWLSTTLCGSCTTTPSCSMVLYNTVWFVYHYAFMLCGSLQHCVVSVPLRLHALWFSTTLYDSCTTTPSCSMALYNTVWFLYHYASMLYGSLKHYMAFKLLLLHTITLQHCVALVSLWLHTLALCNIV